MLIGMWTADVFAPAEALTRAMTLLSGWAVPIWEEELKESSILPAAAFTHENVAFLSVCVACICTVAVAVPPATSTTYVLAMNSGMARKIRQVNTFCFDLRFLNRLIAH
jgi:hypothetical protein